MEVLSSRVLLSPLDFDRSRRWYTDVLGLRIYREYGADGRGHGHRPVPRRRLPRADQRRPGTSDEDDVPMTLWLQVPDVDAEHDRLVGDGRSHDRRAAEDDAVGAARDVDRGPRRRPHRRSSKCPRCIRFAAGSTMTTAFVLGGGGNLGAVQVGMLRALLEHDITPDAVFGCSVGALNGAALCEDPTLANVERLIELWKNLHGKDVLPTGWFSTAVQFAQTGRGAAHAGPVARPRRVVPDRRATSTSCDVHFECVVTDVDEPRRCGSTTARWSTRSSRRRRSRRCIRRSSSTACATATAPSSTTSRSHVPSTTARPRSTSSTSARFDRPRQEPKRPFDVAVEAYWIARRHRFTRDLHSLPPHVDAVLLPPGAPPQLAVQRLLAQRGAHGRTPTGRARELSTSAGAPAVGCSDVGTAIRVVLRLRSARDRARPRTARMPSRRWTPRSRRRPGRPP